ncbi:MAG: T9SS type A sorting domain-containing protein [Bacteroidota bacterium]|nr:T9SS type A sorting domain-containing protein [Bacteroidota bacterium]
MKRFFIMLVFSSYAIQLVKSQTPTVSISWKKIGGSDGIYGVTHKDAKPLQFKPATNTTSFTHLKSATYISMPANSKGDVVANISYNNGLTWDSTCVWSDATNKGMFPQGTIYNPVGNTNPINTWIVTNGVTTNTNNAITGNFYASKQLSSFSNTISAWANSQQYYANTGTFTPLFAKHNFDCNSIYCDNAGVVRSISVLANDVNATNTINYGLRGGYVSKGYFTAGYFSWQGDSLLPTTILKSDGSKQLHPYPLIAFNSSGTVGYAVFIGATPSPQIANTGWQPIVYKTTNSGATWAQLNGIDFTIPFFALILNALKPANTANVAIPQFNINEGFDITVDINNNLHIAAIVNSTKSSHVDSLDQAHQFGSESYKWPHSSGKRPYLYDFLTNGFGWSYMLVDSLTSEMPGKKSTESGFLSNLWDTDVNGDKVSSGARLQLSRSENGRFIAYTYAESDTNVTNNSEKWNSLPNVKIKFYDAVNNGLASYKLNASKVAVGQGTNNPNVANRACFHNASPILQNASGQLGNVFAGGCVTGGSATITVPLTVTNSNPYTQNGNVTHWYSSVYYSQTNIPISNSFPPFATTSVEKIDNSKNAGVNIYPNPAKDLLNIDFSNSLHLNENAYIKFINGLGQVVYQTNISDSQSQINIEQLSKGIYFLQIEINTEIKERIKLIKQ